MEYSMAALWNNTEESISSGSLVPRPHTPMKEWPDIHCLCVHVILPEILVNHELLCYIRL